MSILLVWLKVQSEKTENIALEVPQLTGNFLSNILRSVTLLNSIHSSRSWVLMVSFLKSQETRHRRVQHSAALKQQVHGRAEVTLGQLDLSPYVHHSDF